MTLEHKRTNVTPLGPEGPCTRTAKRGSSPAKWRLAQSLQSGSETDGPSSSLKFVFVFWALHKKTPFCLAAPPQGRKGFERITLGMTPSYRPLDCKRVGDAATIEQVLCVLSKTCSRSGNESSNG